MNRKVFAVLAGIALACAVAFWSGYSVSALTYEKKISNLRSESADSDDEELYSEMDEHTDKAALGPSNSESVSEEKEAEATDASSDSVDAKDIDNEYSYYLIVEDGYINIYLSDRVTLYEYTDIAYDSLPEKLRLYIDSGKGFNSDGDLYDFLENYSS